MLNSVAPSAKPVLLCPLGLQAAMYKAFRGLAIAWKPEKSTD